MKAKLTTHLLCLASAVALAGPPAPAKGAKDVVAPKAAENPLSFLNGKLVFDFQEKLRYEIRDNNFDFDKTKNALTDDSWLLERTRLGMKIVPCDWFTFYVQGQSAFEIDSDRPNIPGVLGAEGDDPIDLRQAYIKLGKKDFNVTIGRQILTYGDERLLGPLEWNNITRTFDAVKLHYGGKDWNVEAFASSLVVINRDRFNQSDLGDGNNTGRNEIFSGIYYTSTGLIPIQTTDLYVFELHEKAKVGNTDFVAMGTRMKADPTKLGGFDYETEMVVETGKLKGKDLAAFAGHWGVGYTDLKSAVKPHIGLEYNFATGDNNAKDGKVGTFQNLFPTNHLYYGYADLFSWQNIQNPSVTFSFQPTKTTKVRLDYHAFWAVDTNDAWYRANGVTQVRPIKSNASNFEGTELDVTASWKATKNLSFMAGYSHFFAGNYLKATGRSDDANFGYVQMSIDF
jgi:hypothetical protein